MTSEMIASRQIIQYQGSRTDRLQDSVAVEDPLEIRLVSGPTERRRGKSVAITMRTPGHDLELAAGFLFCEGIIQQRAQIEKIEHFGPISPGRQTSNSVCVELSPESEFDISQLNRHFYATSSCGVCGKASLEALEYRNLKPIELELTVDRRLLFQLPTLLRQQQSLFAATGGNHAAALFTPEGELIAIREDVGRHNAMDKIIGHQLVTSDSCSNLSAIAMVSGRASFELLQKSLSAGIPVFVAVGAPSSLAIELAEQFGITLVGFCSGQRCNVYCHPFRITD